MNFHTSFAKLDAANARVFRDRKTVATSVDDAVYKILDNKDAMNGIGIAVVFLVWAFAIYLMRH